MPYLNLACGGNRLPEPFINLDELRNHLPIGSPERANLDAEPNYVNHFLGHYPMPFQPDSFEGCVAGHCLEHWTLQTGTAILRDCYRILKPGHPLMVSVPDASYFRKVHARDTKENAMELFGEPIYDGDNKPTFLGYGLLTYNHIQVLTEDALWAILIGAGFADHNIRRFDGDRIAKNEHEELLATALNRIPFSLVMIATKE